MLRVVGLVCLALLGGCANPKTTRISDQRWRALQQLGLDSNVGRFRPYRYSGATRYVVARSSCQGLCRIQRYKAARALDRHFNTNAGVVGWGLSR